MNASADTVTVEWLISDKTQNVSTGGGFYDHAQYSKAPRNTFQGTPQSIHQYFDLASLSKMILTSSLLIEVLLDRFNGDWGAFLDLDLRQEVPELALVPAAIDLKLRSLWEHRSALPAHFSLAGDLSLRQRFSGPRSAMWGRVVARLCEELRNQAPMHGQTVYSDVGFWILGLWLEKTSGRTLLEQWNSWKQKHGVPAGELIFESELKTVCLPTETRHPAGEVNDDNAYWMNSIAPHAGLFGTVNGVRAWLEAVKKWTAGRPELEFWTERESSSMNRFWLGWDTASGEVSSQAGSVFAPKDCVGHLGWTGTAFWWSPGKDAYGILLTNRVFPRHTPESQKWIRDFRKEFFSDLWQSKIEAKWLR